MGSAAGSERPALPDDGGSVGDGGGGGIVVAVGGFVGGEGFELDGDVFEDFGGVGVVALGCEVAFARFVVDAAGGEATEKIEVVVDVVADVATDGGVEERGVAVCVGGGVDLAEEDDGLAD